MSHGSRETVKRIIQGIVFIAVIVAYTVQSPDTGWLAVGFWAIVIAWMAGWPFTPWVHAAPDYNSRNEMEW